MRKGRRTDPLDKKMPDRGPITKEVINCILNEASRFRGGVRLSIGRVWTNKEYDERRKRILNTPLP